MGCVYGTEKVLANFEDMDSPDDIKNIMHVRLCLFLDLLISRGQFSKLRSCNCKVKRHLSSVLNECNKTVIITLYEANNY